jgi:hypothetical protein
MPKLSKLIVLLVCLSLVTWSCASDNLDDLTKDDPIVNTCDTSNVTFSGTVAPLTTTNCAIQNCHMGNFPSAGYDLTTYEGVKAIVDKELLFKVISHAAGVSAMPQGKAQLEQCDIDKVKAWIDAGALND